MAYDSKALLSTQTITASGNGAWFAIQSATMAAVAVTVGTGSGTVSAFDLWLEWTTDTTSASAFPMVADLTMKASATGTENAAAVNKRDVVDAKASTTAESFVGYYKHVPAGWVRVCWTLAGTTPSLPVTVTLACK